jgi:hypothetical protein
MSNIEDRLRDAFRADAQTVPPHTVRPFESPTAWQPASKRERRVLVPLSAAATLVLIVAGAVVAPRVLPGSDDGHAVATGLAAGYPGGQIPTATRPAYLIAIVPGRPSGHSAPVLEVVSVATGRVTGTIAPPAGGQAFAAVASAGSNGRFVAETSARASCTTRFYTFTISAQGRPTPLTALIGFSVQGQPTAPEGSASFAVRSGLRFLAYSTVPCAIKNPRKYTGHLGVILVQPNQVQQVAWSFTYPAAPTSLSLSADGSLLGLVSAPSKPLHGTATSGDDSVWTLRVESSPPGPLGSRYHHVVRPLVGANSEVLSPNGTLAFVSTLRYAKSDPFMRERINAYSTATGKLISVVHEFPDDGFEGPNLGLDPSGRYLLVSGWNDVVHPTRRHQVDGIDLATGRYFKVPGSAADHAISTAW